MGVIGTGAERAIILRQNTGSGSLGRRDDSPAGGVRPAAGDRGQAEAGGAGAGKVMEEVREGAEIRAGAYTQRGGRGGWKRSLQGDGVGGDTAVISLSIRLLLLSSPPIPQEEETLSFIRDSLEKSDQLTKNMASNPSAGRG